MDSSCDHIDAKPLMWRVARRPTVVVISLILAVFAAWSWGLHAGVCVSQFRILKDRELIEAAVRHVILGDDADQGQVDEFLHANPDCCGVNRTASRGFLSWDVFEVEINYQRQPMGTSVEPFYKTIVAVQACGSSMGSTHGISTPTLEKY
ncbi:hypothetical protein QTH87_06125 [Variovorax sp. J22P168]|uniref:hypothetical protein n=1 Tax=Variovorax jilinensis TaxID=3053513 RepID=UPI00257752DF|nr:hypothetical protein [Variovorax sp. J22P168]MDM0012016.1 hypothetical protein [Variovorax sp. J22P168]